MYIVFGFYHICTLGYFPLTILKIDQTNVKQYIAFKKNSPLYLQRVIFIFNENTCQMSGKVFAILKAMSKLNSHLKEIIEIVLCTLFPKL